MEVLKTTSPTAEPVAPIAVPLKTEPSSNTKRAELAKSTSRLRITMCLCSFLHKPHKKRELLITIHPVLRSLQLIKPHSSAILAASEYEILANSGEYTSLTENGKFICNNLLKYRLYHHFCAEPPKVRLIAHLKCNFSLTL